MSVKVKDGKGNWISVTGDPVPSGGNSTCLIAPTEISPSESAYEVNDYLIFDDNLYKVTSAISIGDSLVEGTNIEKTTMMEEIKNSSSGGGGTTIVQIPTVTDLYQHYDGTPKGPTIAGLDTSRVNVENGTATEVGSYTITFSLKDPSNMVWSDNTVAPKYFKYEIGSIFVYGVIFNNSAADYELYRTDSSRFFPNPIPAIHNGTGSSPFDNCSPWKDIKRQTSANSGEVVYIPKFWVKVTILSSSYIWIQIADGETEGFVPAPAFQDRGDGRGELDYILVGRYHCASDFKSKTGVKPHTNIRRSAFRTGIHNLGTDVYQCDYAVRLTLLYLYLVEFADWNVHTAIGQGGELSYDYYRGNYTGVTDAMQYHTGTASISRDTGEIGVQYRYIEGLWDSVSEFVDGIYVKGDRFYVIKNPNNFSDSSNGVDIGGAPISAYPSTVTYFRTITDMPGFIIPSSASSISTRNYNRCYYGHQSSTSSHIMTSRYDIMSYQSSYYDSTGTNLGSRLMELPSIS